MQKGALFFLLSSLPLLCSFAMTEPATARETTKSLPAIEFTAQEDALTYPTENCGNAFVRAPLPNTQFADSMTAQAEGVSIYRKAALYRAEWLTSINCAASDITHQLQPSHPTNISKVAEGILASNSVSTNWSAYNINNAANYAQAGFGVPTSGPPGRPVYSSGAGYRASIWVGLGGGLNGNGTSVGYPLVQSGATVVWSETGSASYYLWFETIGVPNQPSNERVITSLPAHPGDDIGVNAQWKPAESQYQLAACNFSLAPPKCVEIVVPSTTPPGNSVEWVVEAPSPGLGTYPIANYGSLSMYNACWQNIPNPTTCKALNDSSVVAPTYIQLQQYLLGRNQIVSYTQAITTPMGLNFVYVHPTKLN